MPSTTITSNCTIEYSNTLKVAQQATDAMFNLPETKTLITYRKFNLTTTNLAGDLNKQTYTDYSIYVIVKMLLMDDRIIQQGEMLPGDCELFIRPYINHEYDGTIIDEPFEPQLDDEFFSKCSI